MAQSAAHTLAHASPESQTQFHLLQSTGPTASTHASTLVPQATYNGGYSNAKTVRLRLANGGAGQAGLIEAFANAFIKHEVAKNTAPFLVEWYLGDTTQSLQYLASKYVDVAFTYNEAAELASVKSKAAVLRELAFMDHFYLVGPIQNPANLQSFLVGPTGNPDSDDSVSDMFNKIVSSGNADVTLPPTSRVPTRFLSRYDKSATNIKESELFIKIGQVPWALAYSSWYHQYPRFPLQALEAAGQLHEYTLTDRGTWLSSPPSVTGTLTIFKAGAPAPAGTRAADDTSILLNPCNALLGAEPLDKALAKTFMDWLVAVDGGQKVVAGFKKNGQVLYTPAKA